MTKPRVFQYATPEAASRALLDDLLEEMQAVPSRPFTIALSGGSTPALLFRIWEREYAVRTPWERIHLYWVDERCVPPTDVRSNFGLAWRELLSKLPVPPSHCYRIVGEAPPESEARRYSAWVRSALPAEDGVPVFDFVWLGVGVDGHTSSIFPGQSHLLTSGDPYVVSAHPSDGTLRVCLTGKPLLCARRTCFLLTGEAKRDLFHRLLLPENELIYPASYVCHRARCVRFYVSV